MNCGKVDLLDLQLQPGDNSRASVCVDVQASQKRGLRVTVWEDGVSAAYVDLAISAEGKVSLVVRDSGDENAAPAQVIDLFDSCYQSAQAVNGDARKGRLR